MNIFGGARGDSAASSLDWKPWPTETPQTTQLTADEAALVDPDGTAEGTRFTAIFDGAENLHAHNSFSPKALSTCSRASSDINSADLNNVDINELVDSLPFECDSLPLLTDLFADVDS